MSRLFSFLKDPVHVIRFQYLCGVPYTEEERQVKRAGDDSSPETNGSAQNGSATKRLVHRRTTKEGKPDVKPESDQEIRGHVICDVLLRLCSGLGGEVFYITFLPWLVWNVDFYIARRIIYLWTFVMYTGQAAKDIFEWPRPPKPVKRLETWFDNEYGFPSTHAVVAASIPYGCWIYAVQRYDFPIGVGFVVASIWCFLVCVSRLYLGVHTILDLTAGFFLALVFLISGTFFFLDPLDHFIINNPYSPLAATVFAIFLMVIYPKQAKACPARSDTGKIVGVGLGVAWSTWYARDLMSEPLAAGTLFAVTWPSMMLITTWFLRWFIGCLLLGLLRFIVKEASIKFLPLLVPFDEKVHWQEQAWMDIPVRLLTYGTLGFSVLFLAPVLFKLAGDALGIDLAVQTL